MTNETATMEDALQDLFRGRFGAPPDSVAPLKGDGSNRRLFRLRGGERSVIGAFGPDPKENRAFLAFSRHFRAQGLPVPEIYADDAARGLYLEEDLGDTTLFDFLVSRRTGAGFPEEAVAAYRKTIRALPRFQVEAGRTLDYGLCYPRASFDKQSMMWDLNYFKYYFLRLAGVAFDEQGLEDDFQRFSDFLLGAERDYFLYRDFQSRNVMLREGEPWFIDYQGGRKGALQYDVASLLYDAKADIPFAVRDHLLEEYLEELGKRVRVDRASFLAHYHGFVFIRLMQALGAYGLRGFYERKSHFLQSIPYAIANLEHLLGTAELPVELPALVGVWKSLTGSSRLRQFGDAALKLKVRIESFSYRTGAPADERGHGGGFVFDCRSLPNPGREERFKRLDGRDGAVAQYLGKEPAVGLFLEHAAALVEGAVENYRQRNFTDLYVAFGCTGGQHRSVYLAERLAERLRAKGVSVELRHREQERREAADGAA
jgi:aminoglycoside/choline kinase family phosphotransferase